MPAQASGAIVRPASDIVSSINITAHGLRGRVTIMPARSSIIGETRAACARACYHALVIDSHRGDTRGHAIMPAQLISGGGAWLSRGGVEIITPARLI